MPQDHKQAPLVHQSRTHRLVESVAKKYQDAKFHCQTPTRSKSTLNLATKVCKENERKEPITSQPKPKVSSLCHMFFGVPSPSSKKASAWAEFLQNLSHSLVRPSAFMLSLSFAPRGSPPGTLSTLRRGVLSDDSQSVITCPPRV